MFIPKMDIYFSKLTKEFFFLFSNIERKKKKETKENKWTKHNGLLFDCNHLPSSFHFLHVNLNVTSNILKINFPFQWKQKLMYTRYKLIEGTKKLTWFLFILELLRLQLFKILHHQLDICSLVKHNLFIISHCYIACCCCCCCHHNTNVSFAFVLILFVFVRSECVHYFSFYYVLFCLFVSFI